MKKMKQFLALLCLGIVGVLLVGCQKQSVTQKANTQDTWAKIKKRGTLLIGVDDSFVPMDFRQKNGQLVGYDVDLTKAVCKKLGLHPDQGTSKESCF